MSNELATLEYQGLEVLFHNGEPWLTQKQIAQLLGITQVAVSRAIGRAIERDELDQESVVAQMLYTASDGKTYQVNHYSMDVVLIVGYRADTTPQVTAFRKWVANIVKNELIAEITRLQAHTEQLTEALSEEQKERRESDYWAFRDKEHALKMLAELRHSQPLENWE